MVYERYVHNTKPRKVPRTGDFYGITSIKNVEEVKDGGLLVEPVSPLSSFSTNIESLEEIEKEEE